MFNHLDPDTMLTVLGWSFGSTAVGLFCGFFIGRWFTLAYEPQKLRLDREKTLKALKQLLTSTDKLNEDVDEHNAALVEAEKDISQLKAQSNGAVENLQTRLLTDIASVVRSNRKLENELVLSRYKLQKQAQELDKRKKEARTDPLCRTGNRKAFDEALQFMLKRFKAKRRAFGLLLVDVDNFKRINDTFGHSSGDAVLVNIGNALKDCVRPGDVVCRLGGDEFAILLDKTNGKQVLAIGMRIRSTVENLEFRVGNKTQTTVVTMSMGLTVVQASDNERTLYDRADRALYESKSQGRNRLTTRLAETEDHQRVAGQGSNRSYAEIKADVLSR